MDSLRVLAGGTPAQTTLQVIDQLSSAPTALRICPYYHIGFEMYVILTVGEWSGTCDLILHSF